MSYPKIYSEEGLKRMAREKMIALVLAWQEGKTVEEEVVATISLKHPTEEIKTLLHNWEGKIVGRKINNALQGPPEALSRIVAKIEQKYAEVNEI